MDRDTIYIFGHKNPDTDSVCSAIGYAELKKKLGFQAEACRLGELNDETRFVLDYFKFLFLRKYPTCADRSAIWILIS